MTAYRFCRSDDIGLLVEAYVRCRGPEDEGEPVLDREGFKRLIRDLDLWCSSCMVASEGREPVGVLLGAKRPEATLVYALRVHPAHRRRGHGRHLLTSLSQKLAILGPPNLVAEVPAGRAAAALAGDAAPLAEPHEVRVLEVGERAELTRAGDALLRDGHAEITDLLFAWATATLDYDDRELERALIDDLVRCDGRRLRLRATPLPPGGPGPVAQVR